MPRLFLDWPRKPLLIVRPIRSPVFNVLTLGLDESVQELEARAEAAEREELSIPHVHPTGDDRPSVPDPKSVTYIDYDNPFTLLKESIEASPHMRQLSKNAWVDCGEGIYVLECLGKGHIRIEPVSDGERNRRQALSVRLTSSFADGESHFHAHYTPTIHPETASALNISKFRTNRKILDAKSLADAVRGCDTYVSKNVLRGRLSLAQVFSIFFGLPSLLNFD
jgi:ATP-dependent helicase IRC3